MMTPEIQTMLSVGVPTLAVLIGILVNNSRLGDMSARIDHLDSSLNARITDMRTHFDDRFDDVKETWRAELRRVEEVIDGRLTHVERKIR
jgi:hypothetical protein